MRISLENAQTRIAEVAVMRETHLARALNSHKIQLYEKQIQERSDMSLKI